MRYFLNTSPKSCRKIFCNKEKDSKEGEMVWNKLNK